jgi:hypothetical protein
MQYARRIKQQKEQGNDESHFYLFNTTDAEAKKFLDCNHLTYIPLATRKLTG